MGVSDRIHPVTTASQLAALPSDGKRYELVNGVLRGMSPAGGAHGEVAAEILRQVSNRVRHGNLGTTYAAETGFLLRRDPDTVLAPDVAFVSWERLGPSARCPGYIPVAPDLVVEVLSPSDRKPSVNKKVETWFRRWRPMGPGGRSTDGPYRDARDGRLHERHRSARSRSRAGHSGTPTGYSRPVSRSDLRNALTCFGGVVDELLGGPRGAQTASDFGYVRATLPRSQPGVVCRSGN